MTAKWSRGARVAMTMRNGMTATALNKQQSNSIGDKAGGQHDGTTHKDSMAKHISMYDSMMMDHTTLMEYLPSTRQSRA